MASVVWDLGKVLCPDFRPVAALFFGLTKAAGASATCGVALPLARK